MRDSEKEVRSKKAGVLNRRIEFKEFKTSVTKLMDAEEFLRFVSENKERIISSRLILPKLGSKGLGQFLVEFEE